MKKELTRDIDFPEGYVLLVDKPYGWTSTDVVRKVKLAVMNLGFKRIKVGHAGTLDPLATGVLIVCLGKSTKQVESLQAEEKEYVADITLGATTPSFDMEHPIDATFPTEHITREAIEKALEELCGERLQTPPVYSAKKINGKRAYEHAREGSEVVMRQALINIYSMEIMELEMPRVRVRVRCSKGTYIRSIAMELGEKLNSGGYLSSLCRTKSGMNSVEKCYKMEEIEEILVETKQN